MANQPDIIPMAWAANNSTADSIPETTSESGKASWDQGFPVETSLPLSQGGVPPKYGDFNGILKILSQFALYAQAGGQYAWNNALAYDVGSIVLGTDGNLYRAAQASTAVNPVGDASGKWEMLANLVHRSGNETIAGTKTVTDTVIFSTTTALQRNVDTNYMRIMGGTTTSNGAYIDLHGENHTNYAGRFRIYAKKTGLSPTQHGLVGTPDGNLTWDGNAIQTSSDERVKADFSCMPDNVLDAWGDVQWIRFKFLAAKEVKGDSARWHTGLVAQRVKEVFEERGLDACEYGILCHEQWEDEYEEREDGSRVLVRAAGEMWTIRYEEALAMEAIYQRRRADRMAMDIADLTQRLNELEAVFASLIAPVGDEPFAGSE